jgi:hypothetical protein
MDRAANMIANTVDKPRGEKRLNVNLSEMAFSRLRELSDETGMSMTELVRYGLTYVERAVEARAANQKVVVCRPNGEAVVELLLPY